MKILDISVENVAELLPYEKIIKQKIALLINTTPGEIKINPQYGSNVKSNLFKPLNIQILSNKIGTELESKIAQYIPEIRLENVQTERNADNQVQITVRYIILKENKVTSSTFEV